MQRVLPIPITGNRGTLTAQQDPLPASDLLEFWADKITLCLVLTQGKAAWTPEQTPFTLDPARFNRFPVFKDDIRPSNLYPNEIIITVHIYMCIHIHTQYICLHTYIWFWILLFHLMIWLAEFSIWSYLDLPHSVSVQFSSVTQSCPTLCDPVNCSTPGLPVHHQLPEFTQTHVYRVGDAIQPSHPLLFPSPPAPNPSQHQSLFQWVNSLHELVKVLEFQL